MATIDPVDNPKGEQVQVWLQGANLELNTSEVRDNAYHAGIYAYKATNARILRDYVHDNGDRTQPNQANLDHGIYFDSGSGLVANNVIEHNYAHGVQLYPSPHDVSVERRAQHDRQERQDRSDRRRGRYP